MSIRRKLAHLVPLWLLALSACSPASTSATGTPGATAAVTRAPTVVSLPTYSPGVNPLTGEPVADPSLLKIPALLVSISNFPATARPQAGLSFAPQVYEFYITEGATRFLAVFHGALPEPEVPVTGSCEARSGPFVQSATLLGNRAWVDANGNGLQDPWEQGVSGLCVDLLDAGGNPLQRTSTDSNGYYGFNVQPGEYSVRFEQPGGYQFTAANAGDDARDSDVDANGTARVTVRAENLTIDAGLAPIAGNAPAPDPARLPAALVGPVRSGRLIYRYLADSFKESCLIYAFASEEVLAKLPQCHMVFHQLESGGYMMSLDEMRSVADQALQAKTSDFDYASNAFSAEPPAGGDPAALLKVYFAYQNQSGWAYDPLSESYLHYVDTSEYEQAGVLHPDTDRLTGRQIQVQNLVVLYAEHQVVSPTNLDIHLDSGRTGPGVLFRDGRMFKITWKNVPDIAHPDDVRPIRFVDDEANPVPLRPGHTWVIVVTPDSKLEQTSAAEWLLSFTQPQGAK